MMLPAHRTEIHQAIASASRAHAKHDNPISQLIVAMAATVTQNPQADIPVWYGALMQIKVLLLLFENWTTHPQEESVKLECFPELPGFEVLRGVFSPEFAIDSYLWAQHIVSKSTVANQSVLEMGAGTGLIGFYLYRRASPARICAVDINEFAAENMRRNALHFNVDPNRFQVVQGNLFSHVPRGQSFDVMLWAYPWLGLEDLAMLAIVQRVSDRILKQLLESAIDPGHKTIKRFISQAKSYLAPGGRILLISADFCRNDVIVEHAKREGFEVCTEQFAEHIDVVKNVGMVLDLYEIELRLKESA